MLQRTSTSFSKFNVRRLNLTKLFLAVIISTFCALRIIIICDIDEWGEETPRDVSQYILPKVNTTIIYPQKLTKEECTNVDFLIMVLSGPNNFLRRNSIRHTWIRDPANVKICTIFFIGLTHDKELNQRVREESQLFGDILIENFIETYNNLTIKSLMMVKFVDVNAPKAQLVFKIDDDTYLNIPKLAELYLDSKFSNHLSGKLMENKHPIRWSWRFRHNYAKWICPKWMYPEDQFPNYLSGSGYVFQSWTAKCLLERALETPLIHLEDIYITGILAGKCGFQIGDIPGFSNGRHDPCESDAEIVTMHFIKPFEQQILQDILFERTNSCLPRS